MNNLMVLPGLYCLATVFLFLSAEPVRIVGLIFSVCYIPGLTFVAFNKKDPLSFEDLIVSFPFSIGLSCLIFMVLLFMGGHVKHGVPVIHALSGIAIVYGFMSGKTATAHRLTDLSSREIIFCLCALLFTLLLCIPFFLGPNRISISAHAFHHSLIVTQIMNGMFPPENPGLGGTIIGYYWGFHALVAALAVNTEVHQLQIIFILNILSLYVIFCLSYRFTKAFDLGELYGYIFPLAIAGLMRSDAGIFFLGKLLFGNVTPLDTLTASPMEPYDVLWDWTRGLPWIDSRLFVLHKLYNVSGMMLALSLCYAYLLILLPRGTFLSTKDMAGIALIIFACFITYPPLAIFLSLHAPLWASYVFLTSRGGLKEKVRHASRIFLPYVIAGLSVSPYMLYVIASRDASSGEQGRIFSFAFYDQSMKNMVSFMAPFPLIVYGILVALKRWPSSRRNHFLFIGSGLCLILSLFTRWPFDNSYKYNYILAIFFSFFFICALSNLSTLLSGKWWKRTLITAAVLFLALTPVIVESSHIVSSFSTDHIYAFSGRHLMFAQDKQKNEAYSWIRENTPVNALLMLSYVETNWPCCGINNNYISAAIAERTLYVIKDRDYTASNPQYAERVAIRERLFAKPEDPHTIDYFKSLRRPVYLLVEDHLEEDMYFVEERFKEFPLHPGKPFVLLFNNSRQKVYLIDVQQ